MKIREKKLEALAAKGALFSKDGEAIKPPQAKRITKPKKAVKKAAPPVPQEKPSPPPVDHHKEVLSVVQQALKQNGEMMASMATSMSMMSSRPEPTPPTIVIPERPPRRFHVDVSRDNQGDIDSFDIEETVLG